jgi:hypothetical protein
MRGLGRGPRFRGGWPVAGGPARVRRPARPLSGPVGRPVAAHRAKRRPGLQSP